MIFRTEILWYKQTMLKRTAWGSWKSPSNPHIIPSWEYVLIFSKNSMKLEGDKSKSDITRDEFLNYSDGHWNILPVTKNRKGHPAPFPEELIYRLVKYYSYEGNTILDMFGGTGTVASVASKNNRNFIHIDISEEYARESSEFDGALNSNETKSSSSRVVVNQYPFPPQRPPVSLSASEPTHTPILMAASPSPTTANVASDASEGSASLND